MFVRSAGELDRARTALEQAGVPHRLLDERVDTFGEGIAVGTMHLAKGLEFRAVVVMACDDDVIPLQARIEAVTDDADLEEVYNTERHLLYVACTRARGSPAGDEQRRRVGVPGGYDGSQLNLNEQLLDFRAHHVPHHSPPGAPAPRSSRCAIRRPTPAHRPSNRAASPATESSAANGVSVPAATSYTNARCRGESAPAAYTRIRPAPNGWCAR